MLIAIVLHYSSTLSLRITLFQIRHLIDLSIVWTLLYPCKPSNFVSSIMAQAQALTNDLTLLPVSSLTDHSLTSHVASRFLQGMPYVSISTGTLVALNTNEPMDVNQELVFKDFAARTHNRLCKRGENQVIIFLGETGSGKTAFRDCFVAHLLSMSLSSTLHYTC